MDFLVETMHLYFYLYFYIGKEIALFSCNLAAIEDPFSLIKLQSGLGVLLV